MDELPAAKRVSEQGRQDSVVVGALTCSNVNRGMQSTADRFLSMLETTQDHATLSVLAADIQIQAELGIKPDTIYRTGVRCPVMNQEVVVGCGLKPCVYHVDAVKHHNCALVYASAMAEVDVEEVASIYKRPIQDIQDVVSGAILKLRREMVEPDPLAIFKKMPGVCSTCEIPVENSYLVEGYEYCSDLCAEACTPAMILSGYIPLVPTKAEDLHV